MTIPVVYSTNDNYAEYVIISAYSVLDNVEPSQNNKYEINIIYSDLSIEKQEKIISVLSQFDYATVKFFDISNVIEHCSINMLGLYSSHVSKEVWYRIFIPKIFSNYEKIFFIEVDTIVLNDISDFYKADYKNEFMVTAALNKPALEVYENIINSGYEANENKIFNPGVMVFNIQKCLNHNFTQKCVDILTNNNFVYADEETLNIVVNGDVLIVDSSWNELAFDYDPKTTKIIHYCSFIKPWNYLTFVESGEMFWLYAQKSNLKETVIQKSIQNKNFENYFINKIIPFDKVLINSKIVVYGARSIGLMIRKQIDILNEYSLVMHCDIN